MRAFAEWLSGRMTERGLNVRQVEIGMRARGHKISRSMVSEYQRDAVVPPLEKAEAFADYFGDDEAAVAELIKRSRATPADDGPPPMAREFARQVAEELARIGRGEERLIPAYSAGPGAPVDAESWREVVTTITHGRLKPIEVVGDCLYPRLRPGWIVWINPEGSPRHGDVVAIEEDGERGLREYEKRDGEAWLTARRNHQPVKFDPARTTILGVIELVQHSP